MQTSPTYQRSSVARARFGSRSAIIAVLLPIVFLFALWPVAASADEYTVKAGDTLWAISQRYHTTVAAIVQANGISNPSLIRVGQRLAIPTNSATAVKPVAPPVTGSWVELPNVKPIPSTYFNAVHQWDQMTNYYAQQYRVDPDLIRRIMYVESKGYQYAKNASGATGLMQVMSFWFKAGENPYDPWTNIGRGTYILRYGYDRWGTWDKAVAAYLGGITRTGTITSSGLYYLGLVFNR
jgi:LysM repeat protein